LVITASPLQGGRGAGRRLPRRLQSPLPVIEGRFGRSVCKNLGHDAGKSPRPGALSGGIADQILADLDNSIGKAALGTVLPQTIAFELP
jgi:hypothetical protein